MEGLGITSDLQVPGPSASTARQLMAIVSFSTELICLYTK
jgi:hypothetical protein